MNYKQTLEYLFDKLPMYQRIGPAAYKANLNNTHALCSYLGHPEKKFRSIHIAGTNGKGSTAHMLASAFAANGYKTGLATSPHLLDFRERIKINGKVIPRQYVMRFVHDHKLFFEPLKASFFEISMAITFQYFADEQVDIAIVETGLGGRLDSTNVLTPELSVITNIGFDHMKLLGNSLEEIATEKAGIIKQRVPAVIGRKQTALTEIFEQTSKKCDAPLFFADDIVQVISHNRTVIDKQVFVQYELEINGERDTYLLDLLGDYQRENIVTATACLDVYRRFGQLKLSGSLIKSGLQQVASRSGLMGRWQVLGNNPMVICDTAHNADGIGVVMKQLKETPCDQLHIVFGMVDDKETEQVLTLLPCDAIYYFCRPDVPRGMLAVELAAKAGQQGLKGYTHTTVGAALAHAKQAASPNDLIFVGGSTFVVAEVV